MVDGYTFPPRERLPVDVAGTTAALPLDQRGGNDAAKPVAGGLSKNLPYPGRSIPMSGVHAASFFDDYYNRVHVIPAAVDFGSISSTEQAEVLLWNARLTSVELLGITTDDATQGVTISGPTPPRSLNPLETVAYSAIADQYGSPEIVTNWTFGFDNGEQPILPVAGIRAKLFPFAPNWRDPYSIRYEFKTDIFTSRSGKEQRRALRQTPRRQFAFTVSRAADQMRSLDRFMLNWQDRGVLIPDMLRSVEIVSGIPADGQLVIVGAVPEWLAIGAAIVLVDGDRQIQRKVKSISGTTVELSRADSLPWSPGSHIHPAVSGRLASDIDVEQVTDDVVELSANIAATPGADPLPEGDPVDVFNGREILLLEHNWARRLTGTYNHAVDTTDFGRGRTQTYSPIAFSTRLYQFGYTLGSQADLAYLTQFFCRAKGQQGEFYTVSPSTDLVLAEPAAAGDLQLKFDGTEVYETYRDDTVHRAVMLWIDGFEYPFARKLSAVLTSGEQTVFELAVPLPADVIPGRCRITWLVASRFAVDLLEMKAATDSVAETQIAIRTLEDIPVDRSPWGGIDEGAQWLIDQFGWSFTKNVILDPLYTWVNVTYPAIAGTFRETDGGYWFRRTVGWPEGNRDVFVPLDQFVNIKYPRIAPV